MAIKLNGQRIGAKPEVEKSGDTIKITDRFLLNGNLNGGPEDEVEVVLKTAWKKQGEKYVKTDYQLIPIRYVFGTNETARSLSQACSVRNNQGISIRKGDRVKGEGVGEGVVQGFEFSIQSWNPTNPKAVTAIMNGVLIVRTDSSLVKIPIETAQKLNADVPIPADYAPYLMSTECQD